MQYIRAKWTNDYKGINGRKVRFKPAMFEKSDDAETWIDLDRFGNITNLVNCVDAGSTPTTLCVMVDPEVTQFTFRLDDNIYNTNFITYTKNCLSVPNMGINRIKTNIGASTSTLSALNGSSFKNLSSPRNISSEFYNPNNLGFPSICGRPDNTAQHSIGEWIGYCHTAAEGFFSNNFGPLTVYYNSIKAYSNDVIKNQIPKAGDDNLDKWDNIRISYPTQTFSSLDFNTIFHHTYIYSGATNLALDGFTQDEDINIYYWSGSSYTLLQTHTRTVTYQGRNELMEVTLTVTSSSAATRQIHVSFSIHNISGNLLPINSTFTIKLADSDQTGTTTRTLGTITNISTDATTTLTGYGTVAVDELTPNPYAGETLLAIVYRDGVAFESVSTVMSA